MSKMLTLAESARTLVQQAHNAILSTVSNHSGIPYGSLVGISPLDNGNILMLMSQLAEHQHYISANPHGSIFVMPHINEPDALAKPRVSLLGRALPFDVTEAIKRAYVERHPNAELYLQLGDFSFYQLHIEHVRYIAGFGRMGWISAEDYQQAHPDILWDIAKDAIEHMNADHADSLLRYVHNYADADWASEAAILNIDRLGMLLHATGNNVTETVRVSFDPPLKKASELRQRLVKMAQKTT